MRYPIDPRIKNSVGISVSVIEEPSGQETPRGRTLHMTEDISRYGLRFSNKLPIPVDTVIQLDIALSSPPRTITKLGRVCWTQHRGENNYAVGVELTHVNRLDATFWNSYVATRQRPAAA